MNRFIQKNKFMLVLLTIIICLSCAYGLTVKLDPSVNAAGTSNTSATDYSWATMSQAAAQFLGQATSPEGNHGMGISVPDPRTAFAGNFLGYMAPNTPDSIFTVASLESNNAINYSYAALEALDQSLDADGDGSKWKMSAKVYAGFGYALTASGIDEPVIIGQTADSKRNIVGPVTLIAFLLCIALPKFFELVLTFLSVANPFRLFLGSGSILLGINSNYAVSQGFDNRNTTAQTAMSAALTTLSDTVTGLYNMLYNLSFMAVIPIMIALALFAWLVLRKPASSVFKNLLIRVTFAGLGIPLLLACYTAAIDSVKDFMINTAISTPVSVVTSTFCNYGDWALGEGPGAGGGAYMRLPVEVNLNVDTSNEVYEYKNTSTSDRKIVQQINAFTDYELRSFAGIASNLDADNIAADDKRILESTNNNITDAQTTAVINLLQRYTKGEYITAGNLATKLSQRMFAGNKEDQSKIFNLSNNWKCFDPQVAVAYKYEKLDGDTMSVDVPEALAKQFAAERLVDTGVVCIDPITMNPFWSNFPPEADAPGLYTGSNGLANPGGVGARSWGGLSLSKMAAYNLLSSTFSDTVITVYGTATTSTNQVQLAHYAVSIAGQGYMELAYVLDGLALMCCLMVLGYGYGFALLFACFKSLIQMFPKVLTGMVGSLRGIAGTCALVAALIIEIIGTCIMYSLGVMFIGKVYEIIEIPLAAVLSSGGLNLPGNAAALITVVASGIIIIKLTSLLLDYRKAIVRSVSETATSFINKFMQTNVVAPNLESDMSAGDLASVGLGLAMVGASTPGGSKLADRASELTDKVANTDADKVATAAMGGSNLKGKHGEKYASEEDANAAKANALKGTDGTHAETAAESAGEGGHYSAGDNSLVDNSSSSAMTEDEEASAYVDKERSDFEGSIGYGTQEGAASGDGAETDDRGSLADNSDNLKDSALTGRVERGDGTVEEYENGRLVAQYDADGNKIVDNSEEEITGTRTLDVSSNESVDASGGDAQYDNKGYKLNTTSADSESADAEYDERGFKRNVTSGSDSAVSSGANKLVMTDANGNQQEVSIVNAETGENYTQEMKNAGVKYDVVGSDGQSIYTNLDGGMDANTIAMTNGTPTMMVAPGSNGTNAFGGGGTYTLSQMTSETVSQNVTQTSVGQGGAPITSAAPAAPTGGPTNAYGNTNGGTTTIINGGTNTNVSGGTSTSNVNVHTDNGGSDVVNVHVSTDTSGSAPAFVPGSANGTAVSMIEREVVQSISNTVESIQYNVGPQGNGGSDGTGSAIINNYQNVNGGAQSFNQNNKQDVTFTNTNNNESIFKTEVTEVASGLDNANNKTDNGVSGGLSDFISSDNGNSRK